MVNWVTSLKALSREQLPVAEGDDCPGTAEDAHIRQTSRKRSLGEVSHRFVIGEARKQKQESRSKKARIMFVPFLNFLLLQAHRRG